MLLFASYVLLTLGRHRGPDPCGHHLRGRERVLVLAVPHLDRRGVRRNRQPSTSPSWPSGSGSVPSSVSLMIQLLLLTTFSIKAAVFPLSFWLPDSYPTAPAPVTAVFAGLLTKVGVYAIIRTQTLLFPDSPLTDLLLWAAMATLLVGILGAVAQSDMKRMLSFTLVSHIGYMMFGHRPRRRRPATPARSSTSCTTSPSRPVCSSSWAWSNGGPAAPA